jgi:hypothetical protein
MADAFIGHPRLARQEAKRTGQQRYFTGKPCSRGHTVERKTSTGQCLKCCEEDRIRWRADNRERYLAQSREQKKKWRTENPEKVKEARKRFATKHADRLKKAERERARRRYNTEGYQQSKARRKARIEAELAAVAGRPRPTVCDICNEPVKKTVFDHCHKHGHFRGWLCNACNKALGLAKDNPSLLRKMARYLERTSGEVEGSTEKQTPLFDLCTAGTAEVSA